MIKPQHLLVEERGLERQIKKLKDLIPSDKSLSPNKLVSFSTLKYLQEQLTTIAKDLEDIKYSIKSENDRILKDQLTSDSPTSDSRQIEFPFPELSQLKD